MIWTAACRFLFCAGWRDNGWSLEFAGRVCQEYKKFLYLACTAGHVVSPSDAVDQAWHLHLTFSRSYWDELCAQVLEQPLHHEPSRGQAQSSRFEDLYVQTLKSYRAAFGGGPPADIWPLPSQHSGEKPVFRRVNLQSHLVLPRPRFSRANRWLLPAFLALVGLAGCGASAVSNPLDMNGPDFLNYYWGLCVAALFIYFVMRTLITEAENQKLPAAPLDPYVLARLLNRENLSTDTAICALKTAGTLEVDKDGRIKPIPSGQAPEHPFEQLVWQRVGGGSTVQDIRAALESTVQGFDLPLREAGLLMSEKRERQLQLNSGLLGGALLLLGIAKILVGIERHRPVEDLIFTCFVGAAVTYTFALSNPVRRTRKGNHYLRELRAANPKRAMIGPAVIGDALVLGAALWGYSALSKHDIPLFDQMNSSGGGGGCGGGGGGGGGCGGCGGGH